jgi:hypothetical protein
MAARSFNLSLNAAAKRLSDVYGDGAGVINAANDIPYRQIILESETGAVQIGSASTVSATVYGNSIATGASLTLGPFSTGPIKLSDLWAFSAGGTTLHILGIPY